MAKTFNKIVAGALSSLILMSSIPSAVYAANETIVTGNNTTSVSSDNATIKGTVEPLIIKAVVPTVVAFDIDPNATGIDTLSAWKNAYTTVPFTFANECYSPLAFKVKTLSAQEGMPEIVLQNKYTDEQWADLTKTDTLSNIAFGFTVQDENWKSITNPDSWYKNNEIELGAISANTSADAELKSKYGLTWGNTSQATITYDVTYEVGIEKGTKVDKVEGKTGDWEYIAAPNDMVQLTKYIGSDTDVTVPNFYEGKWVESVGAVDAINTKTNVFGAVASKANGSGNVKSIKFSEGIEEVGAYAFGGCSAFTGELTLPSTLKKIGGYAFNYCTGFTGDITIPDNVGTVDKAAFQRCTGFNGIINFPENDNFTSINAGTFNYCSGLQGDLVIPETITDIGAGSFQRCTGFTGKLVLPSKLKTIDYNAFFHCENLTGTLDFPTTIKSIGANSFDSCSNLTGDINIPEGIETINSGAFQSCPGFNGHLYLGKTLKELGGYAFNNCNHLKGDVVIPDAVQTIGTAAFQNCVSLDGTLTLPKNLTSVGNFAFNQCNKLTGDLTMPSGVKEIARCAFQSCGFNGALNLNDGLERIGGYAFYENKFNNNLTIPDSVTILGNAFLGKNIYLKNTTFNLPASLKVFGSDNPDSNSFSTWDDVKESTHMFYNVGEQSGVEGIMQSYEIDGNNPNFKIVDGVLYSKDGKRLVAYPRGKADTEFTVPEGVEKIDEMAFASAKYLKTINFPDSYTLRTESFTGSRLGTAYPGIANLTYDYSSLGYVNVNESNTKYSSDDGVLYTKDMTTLLAVPVGRTSAYAIPDGVTTINDYSFRSSQIFFYNTVSLTIPASVTTISASEIARINAKCSSVTVADDNPMFTTVNGKLAKK